MPGPEKRSGEAQRKRAMARDAMIHNCAKGLQNIALAAAFGNTEAYGPFLRMIHEGHAMFQPPPNENNGHASAGGPIMPRFSPPLGAPAPAVDEPPAPALPRGVVDADGEL